MNNSKLPTSNDTNVTLDPYVLDSHSQLYNNLNKKTPKHEPLDAIHEKLQPKHDLIDQVHEKMTSPHITHQNINLPQTIHPTENLPAHLISI